MVIRVLGALVCISLLGSLSTIRSSTTESVRTGAEEHFVVTQWDMTDGLPQSSVNDILQGNDGYLWLATYGGLVRFDGVNFTTFNRSNTPGMRSNRIIHLFEDSDTNLWLASENGFMKFMGDSCKNYTLEQNSMLFSPSSIQEDQAGQMWITANGKVYLYQNDTFVLVPVYEDEDLKQQALNNKDGVWISAHNLIMKTIDDEVVLVDNLQKKVDTQIVDIIEYPEQSGTFFMATTGSGVVRYRNGNVTFYSRNAGLPSRYIYMLYKDNAGQLWVTNYNGISRWIDGRFKQFNPVYLKEGMQFTNMMEDREGNYWVGTTSEGLLRVRQSLITTIGKEQGFKVDQMLSLTTMSDQRYLFATNCGGVYTWDGATLTYPAINEHLPNLCIWSVFEDSSGSIWFGSRVLYRSESLDEPGISIGEDEGFDGFQIYAIEEDWRGDIWIGCFNGLFRYDGSGFEHYTTNQGLSYNNTRTLFEDSEKRLWVGTTRGLNVIEEGEVRPINLKAATSDSASQEEEPYVRAIYEDEQGEMWIATYGDGIYHINKFGKVVNITTEHGLYDNIVSHFVVDEDKNVWMGSNRGIARVLFSELKAVAHNKADYLNAYSYGTGDGMASAETNGGFQPSTIVDDGIIYFPTVEGVVRVNTNAGYEVVNPPTVFLEQVNEQRSIRKSSLPSTITLPYDESVLRVKYTALNFRNPEKLNFRYKLEGLTDTWFDVGAERTALFTKIPPGSYRFRVTAGIGKGKWNKTGASIEIEVVPPFWATSWFYVIAGVVLLGGAGSVTLLRFRKLEKERQRQQRFSEQLIDQQESERYRIASELHDGIGQQILVIKNRAQMASLYIQSPDDLKEQLDEIIQNATQSISDVRNISHNLRPVHLEKFGLTEAIEHMCDELASTSSVEWTCHIENIDDVFPEEREINFYRVIQEAVNNILRHAEATEAMVLIALEERELKAIVKDDGKGFNPNRIKNSNGLGFVGMRERIESLGGTLNVKSTPGNGTNIYINIHIDKV